MSQDLTARLALPLLSAGQAQKELTHNEALALLDLVAQPVVLAVGVNAPPGAPIEGQCWILGSAPTGDWAGQPYHFAGWTGSGWRFLAPAEGLRAWCVADAAEARFEDGVWSVGTVRAERIEIGGIRVVAAQQTAIADPAGGASVDAEGRAAVAQILAALRAHGLIAA